MSTRGGSGTNLNPGSPGDHGGTDRLTGKLLNDETGEEIGLEDFSAIGRSVDSTVRIEDSRVSRQHALIRRQEDGFWFLDQGSSNGSFLNAKRVTTAQRLRDGDNLQIGGHLFVFQLQGEPASPSDQSVTDLMTVDTSAKEAILLTSDIRRFTALSERLPPDQLAPLVGTWYAKTERVLEEHGAALDKIEGDCVLAYWLDTSHQARREALKAADRMRQLCSEVQREHQVLLEKVGLPFEAGAALHLGEAAFGAYGMQQSTLLGDAVTLVFRLEALTRELDEWVLVSAEFLDGWEAGRALVKRCGTHRVKGREQEVEVFALRNGQE